MADRSTNCVAALEYALRGWPVFPCNPRTKRPLVANGFKSATTDGTQIERWWLKWPKALIAIPTGPASNVFVVDFDPGEDKTTGEIHELGDLIEKFEAFIGLQLPKTCSATTPRGGRHFYFNLPNGQDISSRAAIIPRVDVRGTGGYVIIPPSMRFDGVPYVWDPSPDACPPAAPSDELIQALRRKKATPPPSIGDRHPARYSRQYVIAALNGEVSAIVATAAGARNERLNLAAYRIGQILDFCDFDEREVFAALEQAAERCGLTTDDGPKSVRLTIASGLAAGRANPRSPATRVFGRRAPTSIPGARTAPADHPQDLELARYEMTDLGNAKRFVARNHACLKSSTQGWFFLSGGRWVADSSEREVKRAVHETVEAIKREARVLRKSETNDD